MIIIRLSVKSRNEKSENGMNRMVGMQGIGVGMRVIRVVLRGVRVGMQEIRMGMRGIN